MHSYELSLFWKTDLWELSIMGMKMRDRVVKVNYKLEIIGKMTEEISEMMLIQF